MNIDRCVDVACQKYGVSAADVRSESKRRKVCTVRNVIYWLARECFRRKDKAIAWSVARRGRGSVVYAHAVIERKRAKSAAFRQETDELLSLVSDTVLAQKSEVIHMNLNEFRAEI